MCRLSSDQSEANFYIKEREKEVRNGGKRKRKEGIKERKKVGSVRIHLLTISRKRFLFNKAEPVSLSMFVYSRETQ